MPSLNLTLNLLKHLLKLGDQVIDELLLILTIEGKEM
jgi:hypothetical protein